MEELQLPADFIKKMQFLLSDEWEEFKNCYLNSRYYGLRFNPLKKGLSKRDYAKILSELAVLKQEPIPWSEHAYYYEEEARPGRHPYHEAGLYYIQEPSAMCAAPLLHPSPTERVLDLCAAPGGKSTHLASFLNQEGLLIANEIHPARCKILSQNIERLGIANAIVTNEDSKTLAKHFPEYFHKILVDAPCSGEGMFRKNPEAVLEWSQSQVNLCAARQLDILENAAAMLMEGGTLLYSTCTFSPEENECVIGQFLDRHPEFSVVKRENPCFDSENSIQQTSYFDAGNPAWGNNRKELSDTFRLWPHHLHGEGHFAAILKKGAETDAIKMVSMEETDTAKTTSIEETDTTKTIERKAEKVFTTKMTQRKTEKVSASKTPNRKQWKDKKLYPILKEFTSQVLSEQMEEYILSGSLVLFGEQLYRLPADAPELSGIRVLRAGLHIGSFVKNSFKPAHALALFLGQSDVKNSVSLSLSDTLAKRYYNGETLETAGEKGWCLVCINGYSIGWGKIANGMLKNHYPKGLRKEVVY